MFSKNVPIVDEIGVAVLFDDGNSVIIDAGDTRAKFLLISCKSMGEPIAWGGPIAMNTQ